MCVHQCKSEKCSLCYLLCGCLVLLSSWSRIQKAKKFFVHGAGVCSWVNRQTYRQTDRQTDMHLHPSTHIPPTVSLFTSPHTHTPAFSTNRFAEPLRHHLPIPCTNTPRSIIIRSTQTPNGHSMSTSLTHSPSTSTFTLLHPCSLSAFNTLGNTLFYHMQLLYRSIDHGTLVLTNVSYPTLPSKTSFHGHKEKTLDLGHLNSSNTIATT